MSISFAGKDVLLEDSLACCYFNAAFPRDWHCEFGPSQGQWPFLPYSWAPFLPTQLRVGDLFWPTGAARWACCYLLATKEIKDQILGAIGDSGRGTLLIGQDDSKIEADMYLLPPRPLSANTDDGNWLLQLVDQRYWWQYRTTASAVVVNQGTTTWANVIDALKTQLGISSLTTSNIPAEYLYPDTETVTRYQGNPASLLDAVAASIGMRVIAGFDGSVKIQSADAGLNTLTANRKLDYTLSAGGPFDMTARNIPSQVSVAFRQRNFNNQQISGIASYTKSATGVPATVQLTGPVKLFRSACYADVTNAGFGNTPDNNTALDALAGQIASDYYNSLTENYEYKFNSLIEWEPCFYDDFQIFSCGSFIPNAEAPDNRDAGVRVRSWPFNGQVADLLQQGSFPNLYPGYPPPANAPPNYYWSGYGSTTAVSSNTPTAPTVLILNNALKESPASGVWNLSSNILTVQNIADGDYEATLTGEFTGITSGSIGIDVRITVETFNGVTWDDWTALALVWRVPAGTSGTNTVTLSNTLIDSITAFSGGRQFRVSGYKASSGDATCNVAAYLTLAKVSAP